MQNFLDTFLHYFFNPVQRPLLFQPLQLFGTREYMIYYVHLACVRFEHSIYINIYTYIHIYIYIYTYLHIYIYIFDVLKWLFVAILQYMCSLFHKIRMKTTVQESETWSKTRIRHSCFPVNLRSFLLHNTKGRMLLGVKTRN